MAVGRCLSVLCSPVMGTRFLQQPPSFFPPPEQCALGPAVLNTQMSFSANNRHVQHHQTLKATTSRFFKVAVSPSQPNLILSLSQVHHLSWACLVHCSPIPIFYPPTFPPQFPGVAQAPSSNSQGHKSVGLFPHCFKCFSCISSAKL